MSWILNDPPPKFGAELAECQRYYIAYGFSNKKIHIGYAQAATTTVANFSLSLPVPLAKTPAIVLNGKITLRHGVTDIVANSITVTHVSENVVYFALSADGLTPGTTYAVRLDNSILALDAGG